MAYAAPAPDLFSLEPLQSRFLSHASCPSLRRVDWGGGSLDLVSKVRAKAPQGHFGSDFVTFGTKIRQPSGAGESIQVVFRLPDY